MRYPHSTNGIQAAPSADSKTGRARPTERSERSKRRLSVAGRRSKAGLFKEARTGLASGQDRCRPQCVVVSLQHVEAITLPRRNSGEVGSIEETFTGPATYCGHFRRAEWLPLHQESGRGPATHEREPVLRLEAHAFQGGGGGSEELQLVSAVAGAPSGSLRGDHPLGGDAGSPTGPLACRGSSRPLHLRLRCRRRMSPRVRCPARPTSRA